MEKRKITCDNHSCKHHISGGGCDTCITITASGECGSFEKGFQYYFHIVWDALENKNFIDAIEIQQNPDLRIGLYYVMECYGLGFSEMEWGTCRMFMLKDGKDGESLKYKNIIEKGIDKGSSENTLRIFRTESCRTQKRSRRQQGSRRQNQKSSDGCLRQGSSRKVRSGIMRNLRRKYAKRKDLMKNIGNGEKIARSRAIACI